MAASGVGWQAAQIKHILYYLTRQRGLKLTRLPLLSRPREKVHQNGEKKLCMKLGTAYKKPASNVINAVFAKAVTMWFSV